MGKSDELKLNNEEKKNLKCNTSKLKKIVLIVVGSLFVLLALVIFFGPRFVVYHQAKEVTAQLGSAAEWFTEYDLTFTEAETVQKATHDGMTVSIPEGFSEREMTTEEWRIFDGPEAGEGILGEYVLLASSDVQDLNWAIDDMISEMVDKKSGIFKNYVAKRLSKEFKELSHGNTNFYTLAKSCYLLTEEDYSFWNLTKGLAYLIKGALKTGMTPYCDYILIYEKEDVRGLIYVTDRSLHTELSSSAPNYSFQIELYGRDDFSTSYVLLIRCDDLETAYSILNSAEIE